MIRLGKLEIKNVGPFEDQKFDFDFDKENNHPDIHIFTGANGTGKTTILHALANVFYSTNSKDNSNNTNNFYKRFTFFDDVKKVTQPVSLSDKILYSEFFKSFCEASLFEKETNSFFEKVTTIATKDQNLFTVYGGYFEFPIKDSNKSKDLISLSKFNDNLVSYGDRIKKREIPNDPFNFAAFGYSGYRFINSTKIKSIEEFNYNPLYLSLDFNKKTDENNNISNWIISRYSKAAIEETHGNKALADKYRSALNCLMDSIEKLTDGEFTFAIKTNPWQVVTKYHGNEIEFDVLPDGLRSILSWMGDLLMRLDQIPWENKEIPVNEQDIILFLDEIEVHLHPKWQYRILPLTKAIFPNAQIFITTHSPFILNSIDNAKIYQLETEKGISKLKKVSLSNTGDSYQYIYEEILGVNKRFGVETENDLKRFNEIDSEIVQGNFEREAEFKEVIASLADEGEEVTSLISSKLFRLKRVVGKDYLPA